MSDLVERLREANANSTQRCLGSGIFGEAADRIEQLERENAALVADARRYRWMRSRHEVNDEMESDNNYGKSYPIRNMVVFHDDGYDGLEPIKCDPGALDETIDAEMEKEKA